MTGKRVVVIPGIVPLSNQTEGRVEQDHPGQSEGAHERHADDAAAGLSDGWARSDGEHTVHLGYWDVPLVEDVSLGRPAFPCGDRFTVDLPAINKRRMNSPAAGCMLSYPLEVTP
jgi:hypothetical protein